MPPAVLIVDDDPAFRGVAALLFEARGCSEVLTAGDSADALATFDCRRPAWVLIDVNLAPELGTTLARSLTRRAAPPRIVLTSTDAAAVSAEQVLECGAVGFVPKDELAEQDLTALFSP